jgi:glucokinase
VLETLRHAAGELTRACDGIAALGIACAGQIHPESGTVLDAPNLGWRNVPLGTEMARALDLRIVLENDVRAAAWGEFKYGAGQGADSVLAVFVGTGVGSGAVLDGRVWRGASNGAGEVGHTQVVPDGLPCPCGARGCLERYVSGSGLQQQFRAALASGVPTALSARTGRDADRLTAVLVAESAEMGDAWARAVWDDAVRFLTLGLANYVTVLNPRVLVLGGGVIETVPSLFERAASGVRASTTLLARDVLRVERAQLGDWSGVVGAAALAR